jgi:hypothetical protein
MVVYKRVHVSGGIGELLEVVHVPVDVSGGLEICVGLQLGESLVLLVFLNKTKAKLGDKLCPGQEWKRNDCQAAFGPSSSCILCHEGHGKPYEFFL